MGYDPTLGRFLTRDPQGYEDGLNTTNYVGNSPVTYVDPHGLLRMLANDYGDDDYDGDGNKDEKGEILEAVGGYWNAWSVKSCKDTAESAVADDPGAWGGEGDALRHCIWLCCMAEEFGKAKAQKVGDIHEEYSPPKSPTGKPPRGYPDLLGKRMIAQWIITTMGSGQAWRVAATTTNRARISAATPLKTAI
jgi:uncharacterized protein RhaS with RHS repeats